MDTKKINTPSNWGKRIAFGTLILVVLVGFFALRQISNQTVFLFDILIGFLMIAGTFEIEGLFRKMDKPTYVIALGLFPVISFVLLIMCTFLGITFFWYLLMNVGMIILTFVITLLIGICAKKYTLNKMYYESDETSYVTFALKKSLNTILACLYPSFLLTFVFMTNHYSALTQVDLGADIGLFGLVFLFATTIGADCLALVAGRAIPTKKISYEKLGPGKTWSGFVGGILGAIIASFVVYLVMVNCGFRSVFSAHNFTPFWCLFLGLFSGCANMLGDMFSSYMKRLAGIKDFSSLIPGHGGIMDRINGLVFNAVIVFVALLIAF